jgi:hypothetical protein
LRDVPHLLKSLRNHLFNHQNVKVLSTHISHAMLCKNVYIIGLQVDGKRVSFEYFEKLYKIQNDKYDAVSRGGLRVTRKLTHAHV